MKIQSAELFDRSILSSRAAGLGVQSSECRVQSAEFRVQNYLIDLFCHPERQGQNADTIPRARDLRVGAVFLLAFGKEKPQAKTILAKSLDLQTVRRRRSLRLCFRPREVSAISG